jgi:hypothetical protein
MMLDKRTTRINQAVDECLGRIARKRDPRAEAQAFIAERQASMDELELHTVETVVFRIIQDREERGTTKP